MLSKSLLKDMDEGNNNYHTEHNKYKKYSFIMYLLMDSGRLSKAKNFKITENFLLPSL